MTREPIQKSSNIRAVGFDAALGVMEVEFRDGAVYEYSGVKPEDHEALVKAESVGKHLHANVRGKFPARKL